MMNISKFPHYWKNKHLVPYEVHKEKIAAANRRIRNQVRLNRNQVKLKQQANREQGKIKQEPGEIKATGESGTR